VYALKLALPYTAGVPDAWYSGCGGDLWVEYKYLSRIPREVDLIGGKDPTITLLQQHWLQQRYEEGRQIGVIVGCRGGGVVLPDLDWKELYPRSEFTSRIWSKQEVANWITARVSIPK
jgi:hypothetical protein